MIAPKDKLPVSPMKIWAGKELYHKKPTHEPTKAAIKTTNSSLLGINIIFKYPAVSTLLETYANNARPLPMIAQVPAANPSIPSVKFEPLDTAVIIKTIIIR